jgi:hypothetical protein
VKQLNTLKASAKTAAKPGVQAYSPTGANLPSALPKH